MGAVRVWPDSVLIVFLTDLLMSDMVFHHSNVPPWTGLYQGSFLSEARWLLIYSQISQNLIMSYCQRDGAKEGGWRGKEVL